MQSGLVHTALRLSSFSDFPNLGGNAPWPLIWRSTAHGHPLAPDGEQSKEREGDGTGSYLPAVIDVGEGWWSTEARCGGSGTAAGGAVRVGKVLVIGGSSSSVTDRGLSGELLGVVLRT